MSNEKERAISARLRSRANPEVKRNVARNVAIGQQVRVLLKEKDWTQEKFAEELGKQPSEISRWLSGLHNLTLESISKMEEVLGSELLVTPLQAKARYSSVTYLTVYAELNKPYVEPKASAWSPMKETLADEIENAA